MCWACEEGEFAEQIGIPPALARRARMLDGGSVPEASWRIFLGFEGGSIPFAETQRMMSCVERATESLCARLRCDGLSG